MKVKLYVTLIIVSLCVSLTYSDTNGIWTYPRDIQPGIFGEDESVDYVNDFYQFDHQVYFNNNVGIGTTTPSYKLDINGNISSTIFYDRDNSAYYINPLGSSRVQILNSDVYYSYGSTSYFLDPKDVSILNELRVSNLLVNGSDLDSIYVNEGQTDSITSSMIVNGGITAADLASDSVGASELVSAYESGSAYDSRFVNENQTNSITSAMIADGAITVSDINVESLDDTFATVNYVNSISFDPDDIPICNGENQALGWNGSNWTCNTISGGGGAENDLVFAQHSSSQCEALGGTVVTNGLDSFCRFDQAVCPAGWEQYESWRTTISNYCEKTNTFECTSSSQGRCTTAESSWRDSPVETCSYIGSDRVEEQDEGPDDCIRSQATCYATITQIGCY